MSLGERPRGSARPTPNEHYNSLPRTSIEGALALPYQLGGLDAQSVGQLADRPRMGSLPSILNAPDRVVGDAASLLQLSQGENPLPPQLLKPLHVPPQNRACGFPRTRLKRVASASEGFLAGATVWIRWWQ